MQDAGGGCKCTSGAQNTFQIGRQLRALNIQWLAIRLTVGSFLQTCKSHTCNELQVWMALHDGV